MPTKKARRHPAATRKTNLKSKPSQPKGYTSPGWERIYLMSLELDAIAADLGLPERDQPTDGFDVADAARELARLSANYNRDINPDGRNAEAEKSDWVSVAGLGADLGNMADEKRGAPADAIRPIAHELCYLACDFLF
ncbi:MAG TPA: hypothetical protein VKD71_12250 [Gemmataceae bacterium]|nr:hypothetical protein [Gemmataceae bacterium]